MAFITNNRDLETEAFEKLLIHPFSFQIVATFSTPATVSQQICQIRGNYVFFCVIGMQKMNGDIFRLDLSSFP